MEAGGARIAMVHDAGPRAGRLERLRRTLPRRADAVVFGHSHMPLHEEAATASRSSTRAARPSAGARPTHTMGMAHGGGRRGCASSSCSLRPDRVKIGRAWTSTSLFLGTAGSAPTARRGLPATLVRRGGDRLLFDCGEGTQRQLVRSIGLVELEEVFLTHFHADHVLGLPGMLKTFSLRQRERPLTVYGPRGLRAAVRACSRR